MQTFDIAIIGAGIIGAACAYRLSHENLRVAVIEANEIASGTTATGMGHIVVMDDSEAQFALTNYSQQLWNEFAQFLPEQSEYEFCGTIWVASDEEEMRKVRRKKVFGIKRHRSHHNRRNIAHNTVGVRRVRAVRAAYRSGQHNRRGGRWTMDDGHRFGKRSNVPTFQRSNVERGFAGWVGWAGERYVADRAALPDV